MPSTPRRSFDLTAVEAEAARAERTADRIESLRRLRRRVIIGLCVVAVPLYLLAAHAISSHTK